MIIRTLFTVWALSALPALSQQDVPPEPIPVDPAMIDISGTWSYSTSNHQVSGDCPAGTPMAGTLSISTDGGAVGLMLETGARCDPAAMCMFDGAVADGAVLVSNTATVDDEGGSATNAMQLFFSSPGAGRGSVSSRYVHPKGFECQWSHDIALWRSEEEGG